MRLLAFRKRLIYSLYKRSSFMCSLTNPKNTGGLRTDTNISFRNRDRSAITSGTLPLIMSALEDGQAFAVHPIGYSMFPFFSGNRDTLFLTKPVFPLHRGDIVLYRRTNGVFVVHRIHHITTDNSSSSYYMLGDNQTWIEGPLQESQIHGVVSSYVRKGRKIDCPANKWYNLLWRIWMLLRPCRPVFLKAWRIWHDHFRKNPHAL